MTGDGCAFAQHTCTERITILDHEHKCRRETLVMWFPSLLRPPSPFPRPTCEDWSAKFTSLI